jgi:hypothetical protein
MPTEWIRPRFSNNPMTLPTVRDLAQACEVSMAAALVRLDEVCGWRAALLRWREEGGRFRFVGGAGLPPTIWTGRERIGDHVSADRCWWARPLGLASSQRGTG